MTVPAGIFTHGECRLQRAGCAAGCMTESSGRWDRTRRELTPAGSRGIRCSTGRPASGGQTSAERGGAEVHDRACRCMVSPPSPIRYTADKAWPCRAGGRGGGGHGGSVAGGVASSLVCDCDHAQRAGFGILLVDRRDSCGWWQGWPWTA